MTTTELLATPATDKHLSWMHGVLSHVKFRPEYANATLELTYNRVKGETLDSFAVFTLADGTVTRLSSGHGKGDLNGVQAPWPETRKAFLALAALPKEAKAPKAKAKEENPAEALAWLIKAAENGSVTAMYYAGTILEEGADGVTADPKKAKAWYKKAAEAGYAPAAAALGRMK